MPARKQPRSVAREIALLSLSQVKGKAEKLEKVELDQLVLAAVRTLSSEIHDILEAASSEVTRAEEKLLKSETQATSLQSGRSMTRDALELTRKAINRLGHVVELPEFLQITSQNEVRNYALELIGTVRRRHEEIQEVVSASLVDWQYHRLPRIDRIFYALPSQKLCLSTFPTK